MATTLPVVMKISTVADGSAEKILSLINKDAKALETSSGRATRQLASLQKALAGISSNVAGINKASDLINQTKDAAKQAAQTVVTAEEKKSQARAEARRNLEFALREEEKYRSAVVAASRKQEQAAKAADRASVEAAQKAEQVTAKLQGIATGVAVGLTAAGAALGALAVSVVNTAREFEQYEATLKTVQGTSLEASKTFAEAKKFAADTPFDVKGIVAATVRLEVYGQRSKEILPRVAALAAGMGKSLDETSLAVGKALSGSLEGFESLRNTYGITTRELKRFGAETTKAGGILVNTSAQADKAREALLRIIDTRFGDALANRAETVDAAISNAGDAITNFAAEVGQSIAPMVKLGAVLTGKVFKALSDIPGPMKAIAGTSLLVAAGATAITGAAGLSAVALFALDLELKKVAGSNAAVAATSRVTSGALTFLGGAAARTRAAMAFLTTNPYGIAFAAVATTAGLATAALSSYIAKQKELQQNIKEDSRLFQEQIRNQRDLREAYLELARARAEAEGRDPNSVDQSGGDASLVNAKELKKVLDTAGTSEFFNAFKKAGLDSENLKKVIGETSDGIDRGSQKVKELQAELKKSRNAIGPSRDFVRSQDEIQRDIDAEQAKLASLKEQAEALDLVDERYARNRDSLDAIGKSAQSANDFLKFADKAGDVNSLSSALEVLRGKVGEAASELNKLNEPTDATSLRERLLDDNLNEDLRKQINAYLDLLADQSKREEDLTKKRADIGKERIAQLERNFALEKAKRDVSFQEEVKSLQERLAIARKLGKEGVQQEISLLNEISQLKKVKAKEDLDTLKDSFSEQVKASKQFIQQLNAQGKPSSEVESAYDRVIARVKAWQQSHAGVLKANKDLETQVKQTLASLVTGKEQAATKQLGENFKVIQAQIRGFRAETTTAAGQLADVERAITLVKTAQRKGSIEAAQAERVLVGLGREKLGLEQTITQEKLRQKGELQQLEITSIQQELDLLELKKAAGIDVTNEQIAKRQELFEARMAALQLEQDAELAAVGTSKKAADARAAINEKFALKRRNLNQEQTLDFERQSQARIKAARDEAAGIGSAIGGSSSGSGGGSVQSGPSPSATGPSPVISGPGGIATTNAYQSGINTSGFGTREDFLAKRSSQAASAIDRRAQFEQLNPAAAAVLRKADADKARRLAEASANANPFRSQRIDGLTQQVNDAERAAKAPASGGPAGRSGAESSPQTVTNNNQRVTINIEGHRSVTLTEQQKRQVLAVSDDAQKRSSLFGQ